ncbi:dehydrogenase [Naumannella huperziae]
MEEPSPPSPWPATARAWRLVARRRAELVEAPLPAPGAGEVGVRTLVSAVSRGTETLVHSGRVPVSQYAAMRAPFQSGDFPWPVSYGYLSVGEVIAGEPALIGQRVFCLHPHQTHYVVPAAAVTVLPADLPSERAALAGTVETALNAVWDADAQVGDTIAVIGAGLVGSAIAAILAGLPAARVRLYDIDPGRADLARRLGVPFATPDRAGQAEPADIVLHASATEEGLRLALRLAADEGRLVEVSWYGDRPVSLPLGEDFHARRLTIRSSQVGRVAPRVPARDHAARMAVVLRLLADDRFDALLGDEIAFDDLPTDITDLAGAGPAPLIRYPGG